MCDTLAGVLLVSVTGMVRNADLAAAKSTNGVKIAREILRPVAGTPFHSLLLHFRHDHNLKGGCVKPQKVVRRAKRLIALGSAPKRVF